METFRNLASHSTGGGPRYPQFRTCILYRWLAWWWGGHLMSVCVDSPALCHSQRPPQQGPGLAKLTLLPSQSLSIQCLKALSLIFRVQFTLLGRRSMAEHFRKGAYRLLPQARPLAQPQENGSACSQTSLLSILSRVSSQGMCTRVFLTLND